MVGLWLLERRQEKSRDGSPHGHRGKQPDAPTEPSGLRQPPQGASQLKCLSRVEQGRIKKEEGKIKKEKSIELEALRA
jgi:hypothetical protein